MTVVHNIYMYRVNSFNFRIKFTPDMVSGCELYMYMYRVNSFIFLIKFAPDMVSGNELYIYIYNLWI